MCRILIAQARVKGLGEEVALGFQQQASGLVVKNTRILMYHCGSRPTKVIL
jgi:hypothetical protein